MSEPVAYAPIQHLNAEDARAANVNWAFQCRVSMGRFPGLSAFSPAPAWDPGAPTRLFRALQTLRRLQRARQTGKHYAN